jgi:hypothetical protein
MGLAARYRYHRAVSEQLNNLGDTGASELAVAELALAVCAPREHASIRAQGDDVVGPARDLQHGLGTGRGLPRPPPGLPVPAAQLPALVLAPRYEATVVARENSEFRTAVELYL